MTVTEKLNALYVERVNTNESIQEHVSDIDKFDELLSDILIAEDLYDIYEEHLIDYVADTLTMGFKGYSNMTSEELLKELMNRNIVLDIDRDEFLYNLERLEDYLTPDPEYIINTLDFIINI